jgi:hypothetical protein
MEVKVDGISKPFLELRQCKAALEQEFYRSLDSSAIRSGLLSPARFRNWEILGEGRHFQCLKQPGRGGMDLAVLLAKAAFLNAESHSRRAWVQDLKRLQNLQHPLIPPMEVIEDAQFFAYVQPYCEAELKMDAVIREAWRDLQESLRTLQLQLDDYPQLRRCQGHPFVIDFSELKREPNSSLKSGFRF